MNTTAWPESRTPEQMQRDIRARRVALDEKVHEIERRLSPTARLHDLKSDLQARVSQVDRDSAAVWGAVAAVAIGACMAITGWRRSQVTAADAHPGEWVELCCTCGQPI
jgi:hypothetical protein